MSRTIVIVFIVLGIIAFALYYYRHLIFSGTFDKKYTREELVKNFIQHESDFSDLITLFNAKVPKDKEQTVSFGLSKGNAFDLIIRPSIIDPANKIIGGNNLKLNSPKLDSALAVLGWTNETVKILKEKLSKTNCNWIRNTEVYGNPIEMYPNQSGWASYSYRIFNEPLSDSLIKIHGQPISNSDFGKRVTLDYSSAL